MTDAAAPLNVIVAATGCANVVRLPSYLVELARGGASAVTVLLSAAAESMLPVRTVAMFAERVMTQRDLRCGTVNHIRLARGAHALAILPASANSLASLAHGFGDGLVTLTALAAECPVLVFPSMNPTMWRQPAVRRNVEQLRADGRIVVEPTSGSAWEAASRSVVEAAGLVSPRAFADVVTTTATSTASAV